MPRTGRPRIYPWDTIEVFDYFISNASYPSTKVMASRMGKTLKKAFRVRNILIDDSGRWIGRPPTYEVRVYRTK